MLQTARLVTRLILASLLLALAAAPARAQDDEEASVADDSDADDSDADDSEGVTYGENPYDDAEASDAEASDAEAGDAAEDADGDAGQEQKYEGQTTTLALREPEPDKRLLLPPVFGYEKRGDVTTTAVFPFYFNRTAPNDEQNVYGLYYQRRGKTLADAVFPLFGYFRDEHSYTLTIPPFYTHEDRKDGTYAWGVFPVAFKGKTKKSEYTFVPPLLFGTYREANDAYTLAGPYWRVRDRKTVDWGVFPLLWARSDLMESRLILAPIFFRFTERRGQASTTVVPPFYYTTDKQDNEVGFGLAPLVFAKTSDKGASVTLPPLLTHYSSEGDDRTLITPLFAYMKEKQAKTVLTPLYQWHRGDIDWDSIFPLFFYHRHPTQFESTLVIPPLLFHRSNPAGSTTVVGPLYGHIQEKGRYTTHATPLFVHSKRHDRNASLTWVFPSLQLEFSDTSNTFNLHPLIYNARDERSRHTVVTPLFWDFENFEDDSRTTILFPLHFRFRDKSTVHQVTGNTYYHYERRNGVPGWEFHFFPFFAYGEPAPGDYFWSVLYGLAGHEARGNRETTQVFWIPFEGARD